MKVGQVASRSGRVSISYLICSMRHVDRPEDFGKKVSGGSCCLKWQHLHGGSSKPHQYYTVNGLEKSPSSSSPFSQIFLIFLTFPD